MSDLPPPPPGNQPPAGPPPGDTPPPPPPGGSYPPPPGGGYPPNGGYGAPQPSGGFDIGAGFSWAWKKFTENAATLIISTLIIFVLASIPYLAVYIPLIASAGSAEYNLETGEITGGGPGFVLTLLIMAVAFFLLFLVVQTLGSNLIRMTLSIADGHKPSIGELFSFPRGGATFVTALLLALGTGVGILLCYLPGLLFIWLTAFTFYFFYDRGLSPVDSIKASFGFFRDNIGPAIVIVLLAGLVGGAGAIACGVGVLVTYPLAQLFTAHQYRSITGGTIAP